MFNPPDVEIAQLNCGDWTGYTCGKKFTEKTQSDLLKKIADHFGVQVNELNVISKGKMDIGLFPQWMDKP